MVWRREASLGAARHGRQGVALHGMALRGIARQGRRGKVTRGTAW